MHCIFLGMSIFLSSLIPYFVDKEPFSEHATTNIIFINLIPLQFLTLICLALEDISWRLSYSLLWRSKKMVDHELNEERMKTPLNKSVTTDSFEENEDHAEF